MIKSQVYCF